MHLVVDGYGGDHVLLWNMDYLYNFLDTYPDTIGMTKITPPHIYRYEQGKKEDWGISGFVLIAESHISVHTFPEHGHINIDVFSCREFDAGKALQEITQVFSLPSTRSWVLDRGLEHLERTAKTRQAVVGAHLRWHGKA